MAARAYVYAGESSAARMSASTRSEEKLCVFYVYVEIAAICRYGAKWGNLQSDRLTAEPSSMASYSRKRVRDGAAAGEVLAPDAAGRAQGADHIVGCRAVAAK